MRRAASPPSGPPREVRIIGGLWKRSKLPVADRPGLRPTPDRVRETLFNWLGQSLDGLACLDLYAGSGALGFEATSRGARRVVMVEKDRDGTKSGFDLALTRAVADAVAVPVIASGGVGSLAHLSEGIRIGGADAVLAASIFHYGEFSVREAKALLARDGIAVRP